MPTSRSASWFKTMRHSVNFADAWLAARAAQLGHGVALFDRDLDKFKDIRRFEPKL